MSWYLSSFWKIHSDSPPSFSLHFPELPLDICSSLSIHLPGLLICFPLLFMSLGQSEWFYYLSSSDLFPLFWLRLIFNFSYFFEAFYFPSQFSVALFRLDFHFLKHSMHTFYNVPNNFIIWSLPWVVFAVNFRMPPSQYAWISLVCLHLTSTLQRSWSLKKSSWRIVET